MEKKTRNNEKMSVLILKEKEMNDLYSIIISLNNKRSILSASQRYKIELLYKTNKKLKLKKEHTIEMYEENLIRYFVERLYFSNQIAYFFYMYNSKDELKDFKFQFIALKLNFSFMNTNERNALEILKSLKYNLFTNAGSSFISREDMEFLERIEMRLLDNLAKIYD